MNSTAPQSPRSARILVVDDAEPVRQTLCRLLRNARYEVDDASDVQTACQLLAAGEFDALATDIYLPGEDGMSLLQWVQRARPGLPVVLITGVPELDTAIEAVERGAFAYLTKPFDLDQFLEVIARAVRARRGSGRHRAADAVRLDRGLDAALDQLYIAYQPIVRFSDGATVAYEALMRSREPGLERPAEILLAAERLGRLRDVGRRVRQRVAEMLSAPGAPARVFVNVHPTELLDDELYSRSAPLGRFSDRVTLELTEREPLDQIGGAGARIETLRDLGFRIAIDDLGSGYSSLHYLARLSPDFVKLDQTLVRDVQLDDTKSRMVRLLSQLCREIGSQIVGEGVETAAERDRLVELGCDLLQGYFFGHPCPHVLERAENAPARRPRSARSHRLPGQGAAVG